MKRLALLLPVLLLGGCSYKYHTIPGAAPEFAKADYRVLGKTNHEECGTYILGIDWGHLLTNQAGGRLAPENGGGIGAILGSLLGGSPEESRALYHALDKMPEATHLLAHRTHTTATGLVFFGQPLFGQRCAAVEARGVKIQEKPAGGTPTL
ncbi:MAG: hypothetical protein H6736_01980 [Alphaproteobacteria bacterium]|nr:hypothetical protein [Alphaproteobacteria bacterium]